MPGKSGLETTRVIRKLLKQVPRGSFITHKERPLICGMTALSHQEVFQEANLAGMDQVFIKPVYEEDFRRTLAQVGINAIKSALDDFDAEAF